MNTPTRSRRSAAAAAEAAIHASSITPYPRPPPPPAPTRQQSTPNLARRSTLRKQVSYVEIPIGIDDSEPEDEVEDGLDEDEDNEEEDGEEETQRTQMNDDQEEDIADSPAAEGTSTPKRRSRGGGGGGGFRGKLRGKSRRRGGNGASNRRGGGRGTPLELDEEEGETPEAGSPMDVVQVDGEGNSHARHKVKNVYYDVINDEVEMEEDAQGENKIDSKGRLLGGREYKIPTFTSDERSDSERVYVLGIDAARACGYRETGDMIRKCPLLVKVPMTQQEKDRIMTMRHGSRAPKFNNMMMIAARNVFKYNGAKMIKDGKWVTDDYYERPAKEDALELGLNPGDPVGDTTYKPQLQDHNRSSGLYNDRVVGTPFYTPSGPTTHWGGNGVNPWTDSGYGNKRAKLMGQGVNGDNWMWRMALRAREAEKEIKGESREWRMSIDNESLAVYQEQYGQAVGDQGEKDGVMEAKIAETKRLEATPYIFPSSSVLDGLFPKDQDGRVIDPRSEGDDVLMDNEDVATYNEKKMESLRKGNIVVEDVATTIAARAGGTVRSIVPGKMEGVYEPHTNLLHVPLDLQSTTSNLTRLGPLPVLSSSDKPHTFAHPVGTGSGSFNSLFNFRKVGWTATGLSSWEYVYENGEESMEKGKREVNAMERLVKEAEEWERRGEED